MPVINWIGKENIVNHDNEVEFRLLKKINDYIINNSENLLIEAVL